MRWYSAIADASMELRKEFEAMVDVGDTPDSYGLRVRSHPDLMVTSSVKMRNGEALFISYQGTINESTVFSTSPEALQGNLDRADQLIRNLGPPRPGGGREMGHTWTDVDGQRVADFLESLSTHPRAPKANGKRLAEYIRKQMALGELVRWTVYLASRPDRGTSAGDDDEAQGLSHGSDRDPITTRSVGGQEINLTHRGPKSCGPGAQFSIRRVVSPTHESKDLTSEELALARQKTLKKRIDTGKEVATSDIADIEPSGISIRQSRGKERGLLILYPLDPGCVQARVKAGVKDKEGAELIPPTPDFTLNLPPLGFAVSFSGSKTAVKVEYKVNNVYSEQEYGSE